MKKNRCFVIERIGEKLRYKKKMYEYLNDLMWENGIGDDDNIFIFPAQSHIPIPKQQI